MTHLFSFRNVHNSLVSRNCQMQKKTSALQLIFCSIIWSPLLLHSLCSFSHFSCFPFLCHYYFVALSCCNNRNLCLVPVVMVFPPTPQSSLPLGFVELLFVLSAGSVEEASTAHHSGEKLEAITKGPSENS